MLGVADMVRARLLACSCREAIVENGEVERMGFQVREDADGTVRVSHRRGYWDRRLTTDQRRAHMDAIVAALEGYKLEQVGRYELKVRP